MNDLISRRAAIDAIRAFYDEYIVYDNGKSIEDLISELPSAQPEQRWIPVTEDLPKDESVVLITDVYGDIDCDKCLYIEDGTREWCYYNVAAWMPGPEPWKGGAEMKGNE